jgi:hypothetical protein
MLPPVQIHRHFPYRLKCQTSFQIQRAFGGKSGRPHSLMELQQVGDRRLKSVADRLALAWIESGAVHALAFLDYADQASISKEA